MQSILPQVQLGPKNHARNVFWVILIDCVRSLKDSMSGVLVDEASPTHWWSSLRCGSAGTRRSLHSRAPPSCSGAGSACSRAAAGPCPSAPLCWPHPAPVGHLCMAGAYHLAPLPRLRLLELPLRSMTCQHRQSLWMSCTVRIQSCMVRIQSCPARKRFSVKHI